VTEQIPAAEPESRASFRETVGPALVPALGVVLGVAALLVARGGAGPRPWLAVVFLAAGVAAALLPFRYGLGIAVVLACFQGFATDFVKDGSTYWNETFAVLIVARSFVLRRPSRRELVAAAVIAGVFAFYFVTGTGLKADVWGLKVLLLSAVVGWALARLGVGAAEWRAVYTGLAVAVPANVVLELWQRSKGTSGLAGLGLLYGERIREITNGGSLRAFGGFTSAAPLSYMLAIALAAWAGFALSGRDGLRAAIATLWLVPAALIGLYLTIDRTAVLALVIALLVLAATFRRVVLVPVAVAAVLAVTAAAVLPTTRPFRHQLTSAAQARLTLWGQYLRDVRPYGRGPATAGSAYKKIEPGGWVPPLRIPASWDVRYDRVVVAGAEEGVAGTYRAHFPGLVLRGDARSVDSAATLTSSGRGMHAVTRKIPASKSVPVAIRVPAAKAKDRRLLLAVEAVVTPVSREYQGALVNQVLNPSFEHNTAGWIGYSGSGRGFRMKRTTETARFGHASLLVHGDGGKPLGTQGREGVLYQFHILPHRSYTISFYARGERGGELAIIQQSDPSAIHGRYSPRLRFSKAWKRFSLTFRSPIDAPAQFLVRSSNDTEAPQTFFLDGFQIETSRTPTPYCDGTIPHCRWDGDPDESSSSRAASTRLAAGVGAAARTLHVRSTRSPLPRYAPFEVGLGAERMRVTAILGPSAYRVSRGYRGTVAVRHAAGSAVYAEFSRKRVEAPPSAEIQLRHFHVQGLPPPRTDAERIWARWFDRTPAALQSDGPGLVDNLYVSWLWQYGVLGLALCAAWLGLLLWPLTRERRSPAAITACLVGVFLVVAAAAVNVWEEAPTDLLAALLFAQVYSVTRSRPAPAPGPEAG
jgi:hypothetical protein